MAKASYGWNPQHTCHYLPGRLLVAVPGLQRNPQLAAALTQQLMGYPAVQVVRANLLTGRMLVQFDAGRAGSQSLARLVRTLSLGDRAFPQRVEAPAADGAAEQWHALPGSEVLRCFGTSAAEGLSGDAVQARRVQYGPNALPTHSAVRIPELLNQQLRSPTTLLLLAAGGLSLSIAKWAEALASLGIAATSVYLHVRQELRTQGSLAALSGAGSATAVVIRDGRPVSVPAAEVIPGDLLLLQEGDQIPADARLVHSTGLMVDDSVLTGESMVISKHAEHQVAADTPLADRSNMLYAGTWVVRGRARAVVVATSVHTELGRVAQLLARSTRELTPLQLRLQQLSRAIFWSVLSVGMVGAGTAMLRGYPAQAALALATSIAVASMPQSLPVSIGTALAAAMARLSGRGALVRRTAAMEALGLTSVICTDKTGTLTCNRLSVSALWTPGHRWRVAHPEKAFLCDGVVTPPDPALLALLEAGALCGNVRIDDAGAECRLEGDPVEVGLAEAAYLAGVDVAALVTARPRLSEEPFSAEARCMSVVCEAPPGRVCYTKGAPETILARCSHWCPDGGRIRPLGPEDAGACLAEAEAMAARGLRVLAVAWRPVAGPGAGFILLGLVGMADPPRSGVREAIERFETAGIRVVMLTGDHPLTAGEVAQAVGIRRPGDLMLSGAQLAAMSDAELAALAPRVAVYARLTPEQKLRVVRMLKETGHVVTMIGDGVNDAPAVQAADTGVAMGLAGTDVTRGAAGLILVEDDLGAVSDAVMEGRGAISNIRRALHYSLSTNGGEAFMALLPLALGLGLPVPAATLLMINLLCSGPINLSLATDPPEPGVMAGAPRPAAEPLLGAGALRQIAVRAASIGGATLGLFAGGSALTGSVAKGYAMASAGLLGSKLALAHQLRSRGLEGAPSQLRPNSLLRFATLLGAGFTVTAIYVPPLAQTFSLAPLGAGEWGLVAAAVSAQHRASHYEGRRPEPTYDPSSAVTRKPSGTTSQATESFLDG